MSTTTETTSEVETIRRLFDIVAALVWKAGGRVVITEHDKRIMPSSAEIEVEENRIDGTTTFRLSRTVNSNDSTKDGEK